MSRKTAKEFKEETEAEVFSAMAAEGHIPEGKMVSNIARRFRSDPVLLPIVKNKEGPKGRTSLMFAAKQGDLARVRFLLEKGADPTKEDSDLHSVVYYGAVGGNRQILDLLINKGADINYQNIRGNTALHYAAAYGDVAAVRILCEAGANVNKVNENENNPLMEALDNSLLIDVHNRVSDETKTEIVRILLQANTDIKIKNYQGSTALSLACSNANVESVRLLYPNSDVNNRNKDGATPLLVLLTHIQWSFTPEKHMGNIEEIIEILLTNGANTSIADNRGNTIDVYINRFIMDKALKARVQQRITEARASAAGGGGGGGGSSNRKSRKSRKIRVRKTRKARS